MWVTRFFLEGITDEAAPSLSSSLPFSFPPSLPPSNTSPSYRLSWLSCRVDTAHHAPRLQPNADQFRATHVF
ncbi:hypothetical protein E2C01_000924 [Portunus trituberculatus]|uniref:Uncharacterized protein n=1 Tax=Portunus trituberculatus TaxID=210409 RepID=A0A5B7CFL2_PORTR|nr:hypothetical protein [Portunus trituberculatus]